MIWISIAIGTLAGFVFLWLVVMAFRAGKQVATKQMMGAEEGVEVVAARIPVDAISGMEFTFTSMAPPALIQQMMMHGIIVPLHNDKNKAFMSEWPLPGTEKPPM